ncbi:MAG: DUF11 domain-containing protein, partial [Patulibacter sp.]|nr:DUF11 domain-containing protein [Patulibacter sp.]
RGDRAVELPLQLARAAPGLGETCLGLSWANATVVQQGTIPVTGDGTYLTPITPPLLLAGCYGYEVVLDGQDYGGPVVSPAGTPGELSLVVARLAPPRPTPPPSTPPAPPAVSDTRATVKVPVRISKRASSRTVRAGRRVTFTVTVSNRSKLRSGRAQVCDRMPSGMVLRSVRGAKVKRKSGQHCWTVPALKPGQTKRYRVDARVLGGAKGKQTNRVTIKGDSVQTKTARASVRVKAKPVRAGGVTG